MSGIRRSKLAWMTYLFAGVAGWGIVSLLHEPAKPEEPGKASERVQRDAAAIPTGTEILARLESERKLSAGTTDHSLSDNLRALLEKHLATLPKSRDPAAEARDAVAKLGDPGELDDLAGDMIQLEKKLAERIDAAAKFYRWMEDDPQAALEFMNAFPDQSYGPLSSGISYGLEHWAEKTDPEKVKELVSASPEKGSSFMMMLGLGRQIGGAADLASFTKLYQEVKPGMRMAISSVADRWPVERAGELADFAMGQSDPFLLAGSLKRMTAKEGAAWLSAALDTGGNEKALKQFAMNGGLSILAAYDAELGYEEAVALWERFGRVTGDPANARQMAEQRLVSSEVQRFIGKGEINDVVQSFKEGKTDAAGVLAAIQSGLPDVSSGQPELVRDQVYGALVKIHPVAAVQLFADMTEEERFKKVNSLTATIMGTTPDPQFVYDLYEAVPYRPELGPEADRIDVWNRLSAKSYSIYGDDYIAWIRQLPAGRNRDMALTSMAAQLEKNDPEQAAALRAEKSKPQ